MYRHKSEKRKATNVIVQDTSTYYCNSPLLVPASSMPIRKSISITNPDIHIVFSTLASLLLFAL